MLRPPLPSPLILSSSLVHYITAICFWARACACNPFSYMFNPRAAQLCCFVVGFFFLFVRLFRFFKTNLYRFCLVNFTAVVKAGSKNITIFAFFSQKKTPTHMPLALISPSHTLRHRLTKRSTLSAFPILNEVGGK